MFKFPNAWTPALLFLLFKYFGRLGRGGQATTAALSFLLKPSLSHSFRRHTMPTATQRSNSASSSSSSAETNQVSGHTSYLRRERNRPPPLQFCAQMNADIRSNPILDSPYFDLAGHVGSRAYCLHNVVYGEGFDETATLLDIGVKDLLPAVMPAPSSPSPKGMTFQICKSEGKNGLGMVAAQNIPAGGLIVVERPILVVPYIIALQTYPESEFYTALLRRLSPETVARFTALANCKPAAECDAVEGIMRTNAIAINLNVPDVPHPELATHRAIFPSISRCNHRRVFTLCLARRQLTIPR